eukprot:453899-Prymnesium_polylepis.1
MCIGRASYEQEQLCERCLAMLSVNCTLTASAHSWNEPSSQGTSMLCRRKKREEGHQGPRTINPSFAPASCSCEGGCPLQPLPAWRGVAVIRSRLLHHERITSRAPDS